MHLKISFLLVFSFLAVSVFGESNRDELLFDPVYQNELNTLIENHFNGSSNAEVDTTLTLAQLIVDSKIAPESVIQGMQSVIDKWRPVHPHLSFEDHAQLKKEYKMAFGEYGSYSDEEGILNYFTSGAYSGLGAKIVKEKKQRKNAYKDKLRALKNEAILRLGLETN